MRINIPYIFTYRKLFYDYIFFYKVKKMGEIMRFKYLEKNKNSIENNKHTVINDYYK